MTTDGPAVPTRTFSRRRRIIFACVTVLLLAGLAEALGWAAITRFRPKYETVRRVMLGERNTYARYQKSIGQPYLLYVPAPNARDGHNEAGFRGPLVPMRRRPGVARVLCMGGSTTYGGFVQDAADSYPAALDRILNEHKPPDVAGVEVINGGVLWGTSAELVTHYHFKFHYYRPDVIVINTGGNDVAPVLRSYYQPDYSHWRKTLRDPEPLPAHSRWLMHSRFASMFIIWHFRHEYVAGDFLTRPDLPPDTLWYPDYDRRDRIGQPIPDDELAFLHNLDAVVEEARRDGARVLMVAFRENPDALGEFGHAPAHLTGSGGMKDLQRRELARNRELLERFCRQRSLPFLPFPASVISPENWADWAHLTATGERQKAAYIAPSVEALLWPSRSSQAAPFGATGS